MKILFVCLGNICRSATADEVMRTLLRKEGLDKEVEVDSAGTSSYHRGELPDERMCMHAARRGYRLTHLSRPVCTDDFYNFDLILGMDDRNIANLRDMAPDIESEKKIGRMTDYCRTKVVDYVTMAGHKASRMYWIYWKMPVKDCWKRLRRTCKNNLL